MAKKKKMSRVLSNAKKKRVSTSVDILGLHKAMDSMRAERDKALERLSESEQRIEDIEIHLNLLTRLLTTLCIEKFGMRVGVLKRYIKRAEKEAIRDSQIVHLESIYKLPHPTEKNPQPPAKGAPGSSDP